MTKKPEKLPDPPGWGDDKLSEFLETAHHNTFATFVKTKRIFIHLRDIDRVFRIAIDNLHNSPDWFIIFFFLRSHAAYLGAVRLAVAGQLPEAYMLLRGSIENALYGLYIYKNPKTKEVWLRRHESDASKKKAKSEFQIGPMLSLSESLDKKTGLIVRELYERTIDYGGHPNERAILSNLKQTKGSDVIQFDSIYLGGDSPAFRLCLKTCAQTAIACLLVFYNVFRTRFDLLGIPGEIDKLKKGF